MVHKGIHTFATHNSFVFLNIQIINNKTKDNVFMIYLNIFTYL